MGTNPPSLFDYVAIVVCTLAWGTTWYAITLQLGEVDPLVSIVYRFGLAAGVLFLWRLLRGASVALTRAQHVAAFGVGLFTFAVQYPLVYYAEARVASAVVAVIFATLAFFNLVLFRALFRDSAPAAAWIAAGLGAVGVAVLSWSEITAADMSARAGQGIAMAFAGVTLAALGNAAARQGQLVGAPVATSTAWAMLYGTLLLTTVAIATERAWAFSMTWPYVLSLLHLSLIGSVTAFLFYFSLARRRGFATASYIAALTPPLAMLMSTLFEAKSWGPFALAGVALILAGQWLLLRARRA